MNSIFVNNSKLQTPNSKLPTPNPKLLTVGERLALRVAVGGAYLKDTPPNSQLPTVGERSRTTQLPTPNSQC